MDQNFCSWHRIITLPRRGCYSSCWKSTRNSSQHRFWLQFNSIKYYEELGCDNLRAISYSGDGIFYFGVGQEQVTNESHEQVFKSEDFGITWQKVRDIVTTSDTAYIVFSIYALSITEVLIGTGGTVPGNALIEVMMEQLHGKLYLRP